MAKKRTPKPPSKKIPTTRRLQVARGPRLRALLRKHPELQAVLKSLDLKIDVESGKILAAPFFAAPPPLKRRKRSTRRRPKK